MVCIYLEGREGTKQRAEVARRYIAKAMRLAVADFCKNNALCQCSFREREYSNSLPSACLPPFLRYRRRPLATYPCQPDSIPGLLFFVFLVSWGQIKAPSGWQGEWRDPYPMTMRVLALVEWCLLVLFQVWIVAFCASARESAYSGFGR